LGVRTKAVRQANNYIQSGNDRRKAGRGAMTQALFGAVSTALKGASDFRASRIASGNAADVRRAEAAGSYAPVAQPYDKFGRVPGGGMVPRMKVGG
jgi:hypothetical protein